MKGEKVDFNLKSSNHSPSDIRRRSRVGGAYNGGGGGSGEGGVGGGGGSVAATAAGGGGCSSSEVDFSFIEAVHEGSAETASASFVAATSSPYSYSPPTSPPALAPSPLGQGVRVSSALCPHLVTHKTKAIPTQHKPRFFLKIGTAHELERPRCSSTAKSRNRLIAARAMAVRQQRQNFASTRNSQM